MAISSFPSETALLGAFPDVGTIGTAPLGNGAYVVYEYFAPPIGWAKRAVAPLTYATESALLADTAGKAVGVVAVATDTGNSFVWNGTDWVSMHGANWFTGSGAPSNAEGIDGDLYLNTANGDVYEKAAGAWALAGNILGPNGSTGAPGANGAVWYSAAGAPSGLHSDGDFYLNTTNGDVYEQAAGAWGSPIGNIKGPTGSTGSTGSAGAAGSVWRNGSGVPSNALGADGDFYLNTANGDVYKRASGTYSSVGNIQGPNGSTGSPGANGAVWYSQSGIPPDATGQNGDFSLNTDTGDVYERVAGTWTIEGNIRGATGSTGVTGKQWYSQSGAPASGTGGDQDFGYDTSAKDVYQKSLTAAAIVPTSKLAETNTTSSTTTLTTSGTAALSNNHLSLVDVTLNAPSAAPAISSVSGAGLTWVLVKTTQVGTKRLAQYRGLVTSGATTGAITVAFSGGGAGTTRYHVHVTEYTGMDTSGTNGSGAVVNTYANAQLGNGMNETINAFSDATHNLGHTVTFHVANEGTAPGAGFTELSDTSGATPSGGMETAYILGQPTSLTPATASWTTSSVAAGIFTEILASLTSPTWNKIGLLVGAGGVQSSTPSDPAAITSATAKMCGLAVTFTPKTTRVRITIDGASSNSANNASSTVSLRTGTGAAPSNNGAAAGNVAGNPITYTSLGISSPLPIGLTRVVTGLTIGTQIWIDLSVLTASGSVQPKTLTVSVEDV